MHIIQYKRWLEHTMDDPDLTKELQNLENDNHAIREQFAIDLSFGTAGMRGVIGVGTNRINIYTVRRATQGLANFLKNSRSQSLSVAIGYDSRIKSDLFARETARVLAAAGIQVYLYPQLEPVPILSFATRQLNCSAGIMVTASHNPAKYNGYKVYGSDGCQMNTESAGEVMNEIERLDIFDDVQVADFDASIASGIISYISDEILEDYYKHVLAQTIRPGLLEKADLSVVYSPLNGAGNVPVRRVLADCGLKNITIVPEQEHPDGHFSTCPYPNPEIKEALALGLALAEKTQADLMLATDPDADRVGIAVRDKQGQYHLMSGNEVGVLLLSYISRGRKDLGNMPKNPILVKSIVSTPMADEVAAHHGIECHNVLTGFKYIGEKILRLEQAHEENRFILGFEESYGYLVGTYVRDKDAVVASMLICEAAAFYKNLGLSLYEAMEELYQQFGHYLNEVESFEFDGLAGMDKMQEIMAQLRRTPPKEIGGLRVNFVSDYQTHTKTNVQQGTTSVLDLPAADVLSYTLEGGSVVIVRPSGTEPKVKVYYSIRENSRQAAEKLRQVLSTAMHPMLT